MSKSKRTAKSNKSNRKAKSAKKATNPQPMKISDTIPASQWECPYRYGTLYGTLFVVGGKDYINKGELIKKVAELTGKSEKVVI
jgi:hypothetical protein